MDILWSTYPPIVCISQRLVDILKNNNFTGWTTYQVKVFDKQGNSLPGYYGLSITSSVGRRDFSLSQIVLKPISSHGKPTEVHRGLYFKKERWDGSDIFRIEDSHKIMTKKVKEVLVREKIRNILLTPLAEYETPTFMEKNTRR